VIAIEINLKQKIKDKEQNRKLQSIIKLLALAYNFDTIKKKIML
jgi:hypothetical protein